MTIFKIQTIQFFILLVDWLDIARHGGLDFTIHCIPFLLDYNISDPQTSPHAVLPLDFKKFFNGVSSEASQQVLAQQLILSAILYYFMLRYAQPNKHCVCKPDNTWKYILQPAGFCQGCLLGKLVFFTLVHSRLQTKVINTTLQTHAHQPTISFYHFQEFGKPVVFLSQSPQN
jgi:hypothetical protein